MTHSKATKLQSTTALSTVTSVRTKTFVLWRPEAPLVNLPDAPSSRVSRSNLSTSQLLDGKPNATHHVIARFLRRLRFQKRRHPPTRGEHCCQQKGGERTTYVVRYVPPPLHCKPTKSGSPPLVSPLLMFCCGAMFLLQRLSTVAK